MYSWEEAARASLSLEYKKPPLSLLCLVFVADLSREHLTLGTPFSDVLIEHVACH